MKSILDLLLRWGAITSAVALVSLLGACGQKGPLYLPAKPQPAAPAKPAQAVPAPDESVSKAELYFPPRH